MPRNLTIGLISTILLAAACGEGGGQVGASPTGGVATTAANSVAGTYHCGPEGQAPEDVLELRDDGTLTFTFGALPGAPPGAPPPEAGTWTVNGTSGVFQFPGFQDVFTLEEDRLSFKHAGSPDIFVCTRAK